MLATHNLTIMFTDIVGYTARATSQSRAEHVALLQRHDDLLHPLIRQFEGSLIKSMGDGMLVTFRSSTMALRCAMAMQDALAVFNAQRPEATQLHLRIGVASGDVQLQNDDVFGEAVSVASRIETLTPPDEIYLAASTYLTMNKVEIPAERVETRALKGVPAPVDIYRVLPQAAEGRYQGETQAAGLEHPHWTSRWPAKLALAAGLLVLLAGAAWLWSRYAAPLPMEPTVATPAPAPADIALPRAALPATASAVNDIETLLAAGQVEEAQALLSRALAADDASAALLLAQGHLAFATMHREVGIDAYRKALVVNPGLADNARLADNLVSALGWETRAARELLEQYRSPAMVEALARRSGEEGYWGRRHAAALLEEMGYPQQVRRFDAALLDLQEAKDCNQRRAAVRQLGDLKDKRALPVLRPLADMPLLVRLTSDDACLVEAAQAAVAAID